MNGERDLGPVSRPHIALYRAVRRPPLARRPATATCICEVCANVLCVQLCVVFVPFFRSELTFSVCKVLLGYVRLATSRV
jgi:hypothetical protein